MAAVPVHRANCACCNKTKRQKKRGAGLASLLADYSRSAGELVGVSSDSDDKDGDDSDKLYDGADQEDEEEMCEGEDGEADGTSSDDRRDSEDEEEGEEDEEEDEEDFWDCEEEDEDSSFYGCEDVPATPLRSRRRASSSRRARDERGFGQSAFFLARYFTRAPCRDFIFLGSVCARVSARSDEESEEQRLNRVCESAKPSR